MLRTIQHFTCEPMLHRRPNRLDPTAYREPGTFAFTLCTADRRPHLTCPATVTHLQRMLLKVAEARDVQIDAYCFMPDHLHLLATSNGADIRIFVKRYKQGSGYWFRRMTGDRLWQKSYYDHVVRSDEDLERVAEYILENPIRAGLCRRWEEHPFSWSRWHAG